MRKISFVLMMLTLNYAVTGTAQNAPKAVQNAAKLEMQSLPVALSMAPVRSKASLDAYVKLTPSQKSPLSLLSPREKQRFIDSITFNETGVTGFRTDGLVKELSVRQIVDVLALFGSQNSVLLMSDARISSQHDVDVLKELGGDIQLSDYYWDEWGEWGDNPFFGAKDRMNYKCVSRASCYEESTYICKSNC